MLPSSDEYRRSVQGGCSKLMDKSSGEGVAAIGCERLLSGTQLGLNRWCRERSWKEKRQWVHLMVIVEKKAKNEEVWVNCNLSGETWK
jgi:hypothetical protein